MSTEASTNLTELYAPIGKEIDRLERFLAKEFAAEDEFIVSLLEHVRRFRGKRIRPALLLIIGKTGSGHVSEDQIKIAAVVELIHTATLVHDDILDDASLRRNVETVHKRWGERAAVLLGDFIYSRAFALSTEVPGMAQILSRTTNTICEGELLQIRHRFQPDFSEEVYLEIIHKKTAILYGVACELGARLAGFDEADCRRFHAFGIGLGAAFQIVDDCMDYAVDETVVGKSLGTDLHQGKVTLPLICLLRSATDEDRERLLRVLRRRMDPETERRIAAAVRENGALKSSLGRAEAFMDEALSNLDSFSMELQEAVEPVADYVLRRRR